MKRPSGTRLPSLPETTPWPIKAIRTTGSIIALAFSVTLSTHAVETEKTDEPLNVLFIVVDDLRPELACYGVSEVVSPNFDRLAAMGMLCHRAYAQYPVCNPSRSSFLSGLRPDESGVVSNKVPFRTKLPDTVSLPQLFRQNGYYTAGIGKIFHLGQDEEARPVLFEDPLSWDHFYDGMRNAPKIGKTGVGRDLTNGRLPWCKWLAAEGDDNGQADGLNTSEALRILEERHGQPFFLALGLHKPHDPFIAPAKYFDLYPEDSTKLPEEPSDKSRQVQYAIPNAKDFSSFTAKERREFKRAYQACVSFADAQLGRVFESLDRLDLWSNTMVILIGDHGYHLGEHGWWNKVTVHELGARAPMIAWVPGAKGMGEPTEALIEFVDLYPTLIDYAGLEPPHKLSGQSLRPVLDDPSKPGKAAAYSQVNRGSTVGRSVRTARWRYTEWGPHGEKGIELYDHQDDSGEYYNLGGNPERAELVKRLKALLAKGFPEKR
ncbi:sulfatase [Haloferula rosea]|uniref:Sulfatase n=1 Tax=Haloferula rosea TaxID=490093 RepID=A0A934RCD3_9BACT|nr:sulfatase [Haloferula rosea]MBK1825870.1 sulfatase [Haloferula rosea]